MISVVLTIIFFVLCLKDGESFLGTLAAVNLFFSQAMNSLIAYADTCENQRLPIPVRFFLDDYGATTAIDNLDTIISTIRSRAISVSLILQSEAQLAYSSKRGAGRLNSPQQRSELRGCAYLQGNLPVFMQKLLEAVNQV